MEEEKIKKIVREGYAKIAERQNCCCGSSVSSCGSSSTYEKIGEKIGYSQDELNSVPEGANMGLGCGNPVALTNLKEGEVVLDLGSGAGLDCFLAANKVGEKGKVIGVDMTSEMIDKARENARKNGYKNVEFRLGEIENLPVADNSVDVIVSNCVINLSPNKKRVFEEAFRVMKPGGRLVVSDLVLMRELPETVKTNPQVYVSCIAGAIPKEKYVDTIKQAGFQEVEIVKETRFSIKDITSDPIGKEAIEKSSKTNEEIEDILNSVASIEVSATKPRK